MSREASSRPDNYDHKCLDVMYVVNNIPGPGIDVEDFEAEFSVGCQCPATEKCDHDCQCTRGKLNYHEGRLRIEESMDPVIECNSRCTCGENCNNRLVQRGPLDSLEIFETSMKGLGLRTTMAIGKNRFICEYAGEVIGIDEARIRSENNKRSGLMNYILVVNEYIGQRKIVTCIDPRFFGNVGRYCNHSCRPNSRLVPVRVQSNVPRLCLFALTDIRPGEEITFDYAGGIDESLGHTSDTVCHCGDHSCLGYLPNYPF